MGWIPGRARRFVVRPWHLRQGLGLLAAASAGDVCYSCTRSAAGVEATMPDPRLVTAGGGRRRSGLVDFGQELAVEQPRIRPGVRLSYYAKAVFEQTRITEHITWPNLAADGGNGATLQSPVGMNGSTSAHLMHHLIGRDPYKLLPMGLHLIPIACQVWSDARGWYAVVITRDSADRFVFLHGASDGWVECAAATTLEELFMKVANPPGPCPFDMSNPEVGAGLIMDVVRMFVHSGRTPRLGAE
jgi:hypothetical protein